MFSEIPHLLITKIGSTLHSIFMVSSSRHFLFYMLCYVLIALIIYLRSMRKEKADSFFSFLFPKNIYTHPSAYFDLKIWLVIIFVVHSGIYSMMFHVIYFATGLLNSFLDIFWNIPTDTSPPSITDRVIYTIIYTCCIDFGFFLMHYLQHKISWLWSFHKVHHSAEVLTPFTANRHHPVDYLIHAMSAFSMAAFATVIFSRHHGTEIDLLTLFNTSAIHFFYYMSANMRHSHIWLSFGSLNRLFISPAMHQIHHSVAPQHYDRNFGFVFSIWDWIFRTRYLPDAKETVVVGLIGDEKGYNGFIDAMLKPFTESYQNIKSPQSWRRYQLKT